MSRLRSSKPSRAMAVALFAVFLNLTGFAYAANGGNFILGQSNTAGNQTTLTRSSNGKALQITNTSTGTSATPLGLTAGAGRPPIITNSTTKVTNLNADLLDGLDSSQFSHPARPSRTAPGWAGTRSGRSGTQQLRTCCSTRASRASTRASRVRSR